MIIVVLVIMMIRGSMKYALRECAAQVFGRGDDTIGSPRRARISQFEFFELIFLLKLDKEFSIEKFEPTVSQLAVSSPPSYRCRTV